MPSTTTSTNSEPAAPELREKVEVVREDIRDLGRTARDAAAVKLADARRQAGEMVTQGRRKAASAEEWITDRVKENPWQSLTIAATVGSFIGALLSRRNRSS